MHPLVLVLVLVLLSTLAHSLPLFHDNAAVPQTYELNVTRNKAKTAYLVSINVTTSGQKTVPLRATLDTGSDLTWFFGLDSHDNKCSRNREECILEPNKKPEGAREVCDKLHPVENPQFSENTCWYHMKYGDNSISGGKLTEGELSFNSKQSRHGIWFGLSNSSDGRNKESAGVVGVGRGKMSLISQLGIPSKFSYCLSNSSSVTTKLLLGKDVEIDPTHYTQLIEKEEDCYERYCIHLESIFLNNDHQVKQDGIILMRIDSGSTFTRLNENVFREFIKGVEEITGEKGRQLVPIGNDQDGHTIYKYNHCYEQGERLREVSFKFNGQLRLNLKTVNFFAQKKDKDEDKEYYCLTVKNDTLNALGNRAQINFEVAISEPSEAKVSFVEKTCSSEQNVNEEEEEEEEEGSLNFQE